jgi:hypothetical protein
MHPNFGQIGRFCRVSSQRPMEGSIQKVKMPKLS